jgi:hypothetical protein
MIALYRSLPPSPQYGPCLASLDLYANGGGGPSIIDHGAYLINNKSSLLLLPFQYSVFSSNAGRPAGAQFALNLCQFSTAPAILLTWGGWGEGPLQFRCLRWQPAGPAGRSEEEAAIRRSGFPDRRPAGGTLPRRARCESRKVKAKKAANKAANKRPPPRPSTQVHVLNRGKM